MHIFFIFYFLKNTYGNAEVRRALSRLPMFSEQAALDSIRHRLLKTNSTTGKLLHILGPKLPRCLLDGFWKKKHMSFRIGGLI